MKMVILEGPGIQFDMASSPILIWTFENLLRALEYINSLSKWNMKNVYPETYI